MTRPKPPTIFFSAGEPSGDLHGAHLIRQLKERCPDLNVVGYGGPEMERAGCHLHADLTTLAVMWFGRALLNLHKFWDLASRADRFFRHHKPDAVVLVDYPGFNFWIAKRAKAHGIPVFYYMPPQIWAWAQWRVRKMRRFVDHLLCSLPFEQTWFREHGCNATFIGHPFFDRRTHRAIDEAFVDEQRGRGGRLVTILPGSRTQEVESNLTWFLKAAEIIRREVPDARFAVAAFKPRHADMARAASEAKGVALEIHVGRTPELIHAAECCMSVSGSVSLELLYYAKPTVILYWVSRLAYRVQEYFRKVKYITLVNLLVADELFPRDLTPYDPKQADAEQVPFPEYLTCEDRSAELAAHVIEWLTDTARRAARIEQLRRLRDEVADDGAAARAAEYIADTLGQRQPLAPRPHFRPVAARARVPNSRHSA